MARVVDQINPWGKQQGVEAQRADLWTVDFTHALWGLSVGTINSNNVEIMSLGQNTILPPQNTLGILNRGQNQLLPYMPPKLSTYFALSVALPELKVSAEKIRRDSRPYQMPSWDEPLDAVRMQFILDCFQPGKTFDPYQSDLYQMLDNWRAVVRAGRGSMSSEFAIKLNDVYTIDYAWDVGLNLLRGGQADFEIGATNDLQYSMRFTLIKCWLGSFRLSELNYENARVAQIEALFYIEDILKLSI